LTEISTQRSAVPTPQSQSFLRLALARILRNGPAMLGLALIAPLVIAAVLAPWIAPFDPMAGDLAQGLEPPGAVHWMGTDIQGRDMLSRVLYGARISLQIGFASVAVGVLLGGLMGCLAGGFAGWVDTVIMRVTDVMLAIPGILLAIGIVAWLDRGLPQIMIAVAATNAPIFARLLRGSLLALREVDFVTAARSFGSSPASLLLHHMLPNALTPIIVQATLSLGTAIIDVAGLGFLGLGPPDPSTPEWGTMLTDAASLVRVAPYLVFFPGLAIVIGVMGFNLLGDGVREALDPRMHR
jgi:peptide/nickel transport system permease protein